MNLEALGNIGDFVGGIAVVVTLIYLAVQIRQNTRQVQQSVELARAAAVKGANAMEPSILAIAQDAELARIFREGLTDYSTLGADEQIRFTMVFGALITSFSVSLTEQRMLGIQDQGLIGDQALGLSRFLRTPGGREWWTHHGPTYPADFQELVNETVLGESSAPAV